MGGAGQSPDSIDLNHRRPPADLVDARTHARNRGASSIHLQSRSGDCAEGSLEAAREIGADVIFVGKRGRGRLPGLLLGSVSQKLASLAPCMVVVVP